MANINRFVVSGNLTKDPELRTLGNGTLVATLRMASNERRKVNNEWTEHPNYFTVTVFGSQAEACEKWLEKGSPVIVDGRVRWSEWTPNGETARRESYEIIASDVQFLPRAGSSAPDAVVESGQAPAPADDIPF